MQNLRFNFNKNLETELKNFIELIGKEALTIAGETIVNQTKKRFFDSEDPDGNKWIPLSQYTIEKRRKQSSKPLIDRGRLRDSISYNISNNELTVGTNVEYSDIHQNGGSVMLGGSVKNVPSRPYLGLSRKNFEEVNAKIEELFK